VNIVYNKDKHHREAIRATCQSCKHSFTLSDRWKSNIYISADKDGKFYLKYYCPYCATRTKFKLKDIEDDLNGK
jgi:hypothetical protein